METNTYYLLGAGFVVLTGIMYWLLFNVLRKAISHTAWEEKRKRTVTNRFGLIFIGWATFLLLVGSTGFFSDFTAFPPRIGIGLIPPLVAIILFVRSSMAGELVSLIPSKTLLNLQAFRIPVEFLLWGCFAIGQLPVQMTFEGTNFDIVSGLAAPIVAYFFANNRTVVYVYNYLTLALLVNIVTIAILSMPTPLRVFMNDPANVLVTKAPFVLLPGMLVPLAYGLAFLSLRQLSVARKASAARG